MTDLLQDAARRSAAYLASLDGRAVFPTADAIAGLARFDEPLSDAGSDPATMLALLDEAGSPATVSNQNHHRCRRRDRQVLATRQASAILSRVPWFKICYDQSMKLGCRSKHEEFIDSF